MTFKNEQSDKGDRAWVLSDSWLVFYFYFCHPVFLFYSFTTFLETVSLMLKKNTHQQVNHSYKKRGGLFSNIALVYIFKIIFTLILDKT